ncbi:hypothetical protein CPB84DRAFT_1844695 [Gymnopilus junonius]|uniref:Proteophosphoglycan ppg4 n=1 Tax=Gymnopilus junonius TaxID=109634 RepID=A0A9P5TRQ1_GYMJU|nr:hypothetical protein CPB84DRAFT_1844695 [Gymnopilus junonius]
MLAVRSYERNDLCSAYMTLSFSLFLLFLSPSLVSATPIHPSELPDTLFSKRDGSGATSSSMSPKIWIPIVVAVIILFCLSVLTWTKTSWRRTFRLFSFSGATIAGAPMSSSSTAPRELTAEQLAGTINGANQSGDATRPVRRTRRPRRTPSQMSVTSLPPYNKEPGEEELVIFRGQDPEDVTTMPTAVAVTSIDEERDESVISHDNSQPSRYSPMPTSPHSMPLLHDDDTSGDLSLQNMSPHAEDMPRRDPDNSSHETSSLRRVDSNAPDNSSDPRGEAPSYSEAINQAESRQNLLSAETSNASPPLPVPSAGSPEQRTNRRSGFRTLLHRMSIVGHSRNDSSSSAFSSNISHGRESSASRASNHRPTTSGSGSLLTSSMFRTISRQRSTHTLNSSRLNSPSLISLNSISAPLTHTVTRTEFTYPKAGPTAEQLKVISSRETFARFGVPYGPDAVAFAASSSRQDLLPPPEFEAVASETSQRPATPGPSRLRSSSNVAHESDEHPTPLDSGSPVPSSGSNNGDDAQRSSSLSTARPSAPEGRSLPSALATAVPSIETPPSISTGHNVIPLAGPSSKAPESETNPEISSPVPTLSTSSNSKQPATEFGNLAVPPPSSYHDRTTSSSRSESRTSVLSYQSYATAAESLAPSTVMQSPNGTFFPGVYESEAESQPPTPRVGGQHALEPTDVTIVPDKRTTMLAAGGEISAR